MITTMISWTCFDDILSLSQDLRYQDVILVCKNGSLTLNSVIIASLSPVIRNAMKSLPASESGEMISIICYDVEIEEIRQLFDNIFNKTEKISLCNSVFEFLKELQIQVKSEKLPKDQFKVEALFGDNDHKDIKDSNAEVNMKLDELIDELDPQSETEEEFYQESKTNFCMIELGDKEKNKRIMPTTCSMCGETVTHSNLARHLKSYCKSSLLKCNFCEYTSFDKPAFKKHIDICKIEHGDKEQNKRKISTFCPECGKAVTPNNLEKHLKSCQLRKANNGMKRVRKTEKAFVCEICSFATSTNWQLERHIRHVHADKSGYKKCEKCKSLLIESEFGDHTCVMFSCEVCGKEFGNKKSLRNHINNTHDKKDLSSCETCGKLVKISGMKTHVAIHHLPDKKIPCHICGKKLRSELQLKGHLKHHSKEKEFCIICNKKVDKLKRHMICVHTRDEDKNYQCEDCGKGFQYEHNLKHHRMNMHIKSRPYECRYGCKFAYNDVSNRNAHEKKTHGKKFDEQEEVEMSN